MYYVILISGRLVILGADDGMSLGLRVWGSGSIGVTHGVWTAARFAAEGLASGLRAQLKPHGVPVISLHPDAYYAQKYIHSFPYLALSNFKRNKEWEGLTRNKSFAG